MRGMMVLGVMAAMAATGCSAARGRDPGPQVDRSYTVGNFDKIDLAGAYDLTVRTGAAVSVKAHGGANILERLKVEVRNGTLVIEPKEKGWHWGNHGKVKLDVTVPALSAAQLSGAGDININEVKGNRFAGGVHGAGDLTVEKAEVGELRLEINGAGSAVVRSGTAKSVALDVSGAGDVDTKGVKAETASVSIAGAGGARANASQTASVSIMGAGDVEMVGGAKCSVSKAGAGNVSCS